MPAAVWFAMIAMFLIFWSLGKQGGDEDDREGKR